MNDRFIIYTHRSTEFENLVKIGPVLSEIFGGKSQFLVIVPKVAISTLLISWFTGRNVTKFIQNIRKSFPFNIHKSEWRSYNLFRNASTTNEGGVGNFTPKLVAMATSLEQSGKTAYIVNLRTNTYHTVNI